MSKEWSNVGGGGCRGPGCCGEEWSVHAHLTLNPGAVAVGSRGDSGYGSEKGCPGVGARATCSVTLAGQHTVTLTCTEIPPHPAPPPPPRERWVFCHHHEKQQQQQRQQQQQPAPPPPPPPLLKDAAIQTSTSHIPQLFQPQPQTQHLQPTPKSKGLRRSPARLKRQGKSNGEAGAVRSTGASSSDGKKNPRTVHIDVYCTGSESSDSNSSEEESAATPQTVFESERVKVIHQRSGSDSLPHSLQRARRCVLGEAGEEGGLGPADCRGETLSPRCPSGGGGEGFGPGSLSVAGSRGDSLSSGYPSAVSSRTDGLSLTSGSFLSSSAPGSSIAAVTSAKDTDFSSRDSFDYENSFDRLRIKEKEKLWGSPFGIRSVTVEESSESSSSDSEEGMAWSFERGTFLKREDTVKRPPLRKSSSARAELSKSGSLSDSEACSLKYKRDPFKKPCNNPFSNSSKAKIFGPMISTLRKPGHHVGPSKNPNCSCDTCRYFFEHVCCRNRTRSLGDRPL